MPEPTRLDRNFVALQEALAGRYSLERELGRGGMGIVYLAQDVRLDRPVALKLLPPELAAQPVLRERFLREARTAAKLSHPNIVPIHAVDEVGDFVFFVMAFVEGQTLGERVRGRGPVPAREAARILREVSWALSYAHAQGVVHRDVKPDNILLEAGGGRAMVTDFGIAHVGEAAGLTSGAELLGTPEFMSPEQAGGEEVDGRSDLYALGVVGHYMLSGQLPLQGTAAQATLAKQLTQPAPALVAVAPEVPGALAAAVDRCLEKDPAARFQGGEALAEVLGRVLRDRKEVPAAIRVFQEQLKESSTTLAVVAMMVVMTIGMAFAAASEGAGTLLEYLMMIVLPNLLWVLPPTGILGAIARRVIKAGYGYDETTLALRGEVEERRRELATEVGGAETWVDVWARRIGVGGGLLGILGVFSILFAPIGMIEEFFWSLFVPGLVAGLGGGITSAVRHHLRRAIPGERWLAFWESPVGRALYAAAGIGVDRGQGAAGGSYRPTEVAIGMAAERLFEELPKDVRGSLGDVPEVVRALEDHAEKMRARLRELDRVLGDIDGEAVRKGVEASSGRPGGFEDDDALGRRRASLSADVGAARGAAEERLREVVAALENIRLELLRLHAGQGTVESLTVDLSAARELTRNVRFLVEGAREVDQMLGHAAELPEPDTPVPT